MLIWRGKQLSRGILLRRGWPSLTASSSTTPGAVGQFRIRLHGSEWVEDPSWSRPLAGEARSRAVGELAAFLAASSRLAVITGAGASTASGIPDYRGPDGSYKSGHVPISHQEFTRSPAARRRYWARSLFGFERLKEALPNRGHAALARLEAAGKVRAVITQNVDGLHAAAGSRKIVDLHGRIDRVVCLACADQTARRDFQVVTRRCGRRRRCLPQPLQL